MFNLTPATQEEHDSLVEKCQKNGWLKRGGFDWQDDPWLEEYPYEFSRASTIKDLADFFSNGNWRYAKACSSVTLLSSSRSTGATNGGR